MSYCSVFKPQSHQKYLALFLFWRAKKKKCKLLQWQYDGFHLYPDLKAQTARVTEHLVFTITAFPFAVSFDWGHIYIYIQHLVLTAATFYYQCVAFKLW